MALTKWKASSAQTKIASAAAALGEIMHIGNFAYVYFSDPDGARGIAFFGMAEMGIELSPAYILFSLGIFFAVESAVTAGLFFVKIWARTFTIWWGILSLVMVALSFKNLTVWLLPQVLYIVAATALLFARKDFAEK